MEPSSFSNSPDSTHLTSSPSKLLSNFPSRTSFCHTVNSSNPGGIRVYTCVHDTSPPEGQEIKTNQTNILIRSLQIKKQKGDSSSKDAKGVAATEGSRKRAPERVMDGRASSKRNNNQFASGQEGSSSRTTTTDKDYYTLTVERLRALLKERGLSPKGKKDELVARLRSANG